jgi:hypothetical protein
MKTTDLHFDETSVMRHGCVLFPMQSLSRFEKIVLELDPSSWSETAYWIRYLRQPRSIRDLRLLQ